MVDVLKAVFGGIIKGLQDSVLGTLKVYQICRELEMKEMEARKQDAAPMTTLAKRRAEKQKENPNVAAKSSRPRLFQRILSCCALNGGFFMCSLLFFYGVVLPGLEFMTHLMYGGSATYSRVWSYTGTVLSWTFSALWVLPLIIITKIVNSFWFQDIADCAYRRTRGRPKYLSVSKIIADNLFTIVLQGLFIIQGMLAKLLPVASIGELVYLLHMSLLYSLYAFEYKWFNMGWTVDRRVSKVECNWPYFVGFGLPLALLTSLPSSSVVGGCIFSVLFPLFIISANEATTPSHSIDFPLRLFCPAVYISNLLFLQTTPKRSQSPSSTAATEAAATQCGGGGSGPATPAKRVTVRDQPVPR